MPIPSPMPGHVGAGEAASGWASRAGVARAATVGLVVAMLAVVAVAGWSAVTGNRAAARAHDATVVADAYAGARDALTHQDAVRHDLTPGDPVAIATNERSERAVTEAITRLLEGEAGGHSSDVQAMLRAHEAYARALRDLLGSASSDGAVPNDDRVDQLAAHLQSTLDAEAAEHQREARQALSEMRQTQRTTFWLTGAVSVVALLLLWLFTRVLRFHRSALAGQAEDMRQAALHDGLTGLGNRSLLGLQLRAALAARRGDAEVALLLIDLDRFKEINDTLGHHYGDKLLQQIGPRLRPLLRGHDLVARLGGDEFAVLLPDVTSGEQARDIAGRLQSALLEGFEVDGVSLAIEASVGVAVSGIHGEDADGLLQRADIAMYAAKRRGGGVRLFEAAMDSHSPERLTLLSDLRLALQRRELVLHFQPKVSLPSGRPVGLEALVRWQHPERGLVPPAEFIGLAEGTGLIEPLTRYVLDAALEQCAQWRRAGHDLAVAVNVSARNLLDDDLVEEVARLLARHHLPAAALVLEVTESAVMADPEKAGEVLVRLHDLGVGVALDDFGAGYTSLAQLRNLPLSELKIDRQFVAELATRSDDEMIVRSIVELGHNLGFTLVAEGVEDAASAERLARTGCETAQGFFFARPIPGVMLDDWLRAHTVAATEPGPVMEPEPEPAEAIQPTSA
jgi:diguanylate cyclase (GGDEF)-like protein